MKLENIENEIVNFIITNMTIDEPWVSYNLVQEKFNYITEIDYLLFMLVENGKLSFNYDQTKNVNTDNTIDISNLLFSYEEYRLQLAKEYINNNIESGIEGYRELMEIYVKNEEYEKAAYYRDLIDEVKKLNNLR
jgi:excinuclease UvrABC helicase subunit UvrB